MIDETPGRLAGRAHVRAVTLCAAGLLLAGCTVGPDFRQPSLWSPLSWFSGADRPKPAKVASEPVPAPVNPDWWTLFHDRTLTSLVRRVAASNLDVRTAGLRLAEARQQRAIAASNELPSLNGNASYTRERASQKGIFGLAGQGASAGGASAAGGAGSSAGGASGTGASGGAGATPGTVANGTGFGAGGIPGQSLGSGPFNLFQYGFDASWELDLWGRVRRSVESADASVQASAEARRSTLVSVMAEVARDYVQLRGIQTSLRIARENLQSEQQSLNLTRQRFQGGLTSELDVANAAAQVATTQSQIPNLEQQEAATINQLSFLLGETPGALRGELSTPRPVPPVPPQVPVGVPSELARRRPDIREAEAQLHAATADIGVAVANFYPSITLSGSLSLQALQFKDLGNWNARQYAFGPSLYLPVFEGGRLRATLELRKTQQQEAATNYQKVVLQAWHEVDNALTAYRDEQRRRDQLAVAVAQNRRAVALAQQQYTQGVTDFLQVLTAQRNLLVAEQQEADSTTTVSTDLVQLYKALGGGWEEAFPRPPKRVRQVRS